MHKLQIHKLVSRCDHLNISAAFLIEKNLNYHKGRHFLESPEITVLLKKQMVWKAPFQFMLNVEIKCEILHK